MSEILTTDPIKIFPSPFNQERSKRYNVESLAELGRKMKMLGQIEPAITRPRPGGAADEYELVVGERRWNGAKLEEMPLQHIVRNLTDREVCDVMVSENLDRENMTAVEEACVFADLLKARSSDGELVYPTRDSLCRVTGRKQSTIEDRLKLLEAPEFLLTAIEQGIIAARVGEKIGRLHPRLREEAAKRALRPTMKTTPLTVTEVEEMIANDYQKPLRGCGFKQDDADALPLDVKQRFGFIASDEPTANDGTCERCQWRSGNDPSLNGKLQETHGGGSGGGTGGIDPNLCLMPECFRSKVAEALRREASAADAAGARTMPADKAKRLLKGYSIDLGVFIVDNEKYVCLEHEPGFEHVGHFGTDDMPTWSELLEGVKTTPILIRDPKRKETRAYLESDEAVRLATAKMREAGKANVFKSSPAGESAKPAAPKAAAETPPPLEPTDKEGIEALDYFEEGERLRQIVLSEFGGNVRNRGFSAQLAGDLLALQVSVATEPSLEQALKLLEVDASEWRNEHHMRKLVLARLNEHRENEPLAVLAVLLAAESLNLIHGDEVRNPEFELLMERHGVSVARLEMALGNKTQDPRLEDTRLEVVSADVPDSGKTMLANIELASGTLEPLAGPYERRFIVENEQPQADIQTAESYIRECAHCHENIQSADESAFFEHVKKCSKKNHPPAHTEMVERQAAPDREAEGLKSYLETGSLVMTAEATGINIGTLQNWHKRRKWAALRKAELAKKK